jgi:uncharacterized membrane protein YfcA
MHFPASGVECAWWIPPVVAFGLALLTAPAGISGAFLLLPFQMSVLGFVSPAVTPTNLIFNTVAIPGGVYRYIRERRMVWPVAFAITLGTLPGVFAGALIRTRYLPDPRSSKLFVAGVLLYMGVRLLSSRPDAPACGGAVVGASSISVHRIDYEYGGEKFSLNPAALVALALVVGVVGGIYGVGGGAIIAPYLMAILGLPAYTVAGAALVGTFVTSIAGVAGFAVMGQVPDWRLGLLFGAGGFAGSYWGARLQKRLPERWIRLLVAVLVLAISGAYTAQFFVAI